MDMTVERDRYVWTPAEIDFFEGYRDGRDPGAPVPGKNRSHCYRHSFAVGRAQVSGRPLVAEASRRAARIAEVLDAMACDPITQISSVH
jgi:hypothetical protein